MTRLEEFSLALGRVNDLEESVRKLYVLLQYKQPGLSVWACEVGAAMKDVRKRIDDISGGQ
jgi:hypothetical protein